MVGGLSDLKVLQTMLVNRDVPFVVERDERFCDGKTVSVENWAADPVDHFMREEPGRRGVPGYSGFSTTWYFDADGELVAVGSWE